MDENLHADKCKNTQINTHFVEHKKDLHVCWQWRTEGATWRVNVEAHSSFLQTGTLEKRKNIIIYFLLLSLSLTQHKIINWGFLLWWFLWLILKRSGETDGLRAELDNWRILHLFCKKRKSTVEKRLHYCDETCQGQRLVWNPAHTLPVNTNHHHHTLIDKENPDWPHNQKPRSNSLHPARLNFSPSDYFNEMCNFDTGETAVCTPVPNNSQCWFLLRGVSEVG